MKDEQSGTPDGGDREVPHDQDAAEATPPAASAAMLCAVCGAGYGADMRFCPIDGSILRPANDGRSDLIGAVIDERYYLTKKLGHGGMGDVYLGEHVRTQRLCAVKVVARRQARDPEALGRFLREATNAGRISHHNVATVYDFGETADGLVYLAMEYVDGEPLSLILEREGALPPVRAVEIARQVAEGVSAAHELGIVHRDLKPGNILIAQDRRGGDLVKVVDFGIARAPADEQQNLTRTGIIIGTPEYMSPEQLIGDPVDGRSDIYSLGCILYQMLTGEQAFGGVTAQVITRRLTEKPPRPREKNPAIPKPLDDLIVTALGRTPQERFQTMDAVRDALLAAPAQSPATGPQRVVAWLGLQSRPGEGPTQAPAGAAAVTGPVTGAGSPSTTPRSPATDPTLTPETDPTGSPIEGSYSGLFASDSVAEIEAAGGDGHGQDEPGAWQDDETPRRTLPLRKAAVAAGAALLLITVLALVRGGRDADASSSILAADTMSSAIDSIPAPPAVPDPTLLAQIWSRLALAEQQDFEDQFVAAFHTLQSADSSVTTVLAQFPGSAEVQILADSVQSQIQGTLSRCTSLRDVNLKRNMTGPECPVVEPPPEPDSILETDSISTTVSL
jgi:serine/threonine protein kinase